MKTFEVLFHTPSPSQHCKAVGARGFYAEFEIIKIETDATTNGTPLKTRPQKYKKLSPVGMCPIVSFTLFTHIFN